MKYNASVNIENGIGKDYNYIVTPNVQRVLADIIDGTNQGSHSYSIIGTYGTGKSAFLIALENGLLQNDKSLLAENSVFFGLKKFEVINIVGDYISLRSLLMKKLGLDDGQNVLNELKALCKKAEATDKALVLVIDEFGKILEHAAKNNPEEELYFIQQLAELINDHRRRALLLTTLHQNFGSYAYQLSEPQRNEWQKVKGRFKEVVFSEPVEQLLYLAAEQIASVGKTPASSHQFQRIFCIAKEGKFISDGFSLATAEKLYPLDPLAAECLTLAIQKYGQNERSLFSFLTANGKYSINSFETQENYTYNLACVYDYLTYNFYSAISEVNMDSTGWSAIKVAIGRVESGIIDDTDVDDALKIIKTIGLLNIFSGSETTFSKESIITYAKYALNIADAGPLLSKLESVKVIRFASYKSQYILFEGTDIDIETELLKASTIVPTPIASIEELKDYIAPKIASASAEFYKKGTPRYFEFIILNEPEIKVPEGEIDGFCELVFPLDSSCIKDVIAQSQENPHANIYAVFNNVDEIVRHLHEIKKLQYVLEHKAIDDNVAKREILNIQEFEKAKLNASLNDYLFCGDGLVSWYFKGKQIEVKSRRDFNKLLSKVCDEIYYGTPIMRNELFNKQKISSAISLAKSNLLDALLLNSDKEDLGFDPQAFPPEKTIYLSLLKNTGIHRMDEEGMFVLGNPSDPGMSTFWDACQDFIASTTERPRKISELIKILTAAPFKVKQGFIDFWIPIYLYVRQQDFALYGPSGNYVMSITKEFFDLLWKHPGDYTIKAFNVSGIRLEFFKKYRQFLHQDDEVAVGKTSFSKTYTPFLKYYKGLNDYAKSTKKFSNPGTAKFRDVLASASDPEKAFFEDLPEALGYRGSALTNNDEFIQDYLSKIQGAIRELNACYPELINRIEGRIVEQLGIPPIFGQYKPILELRYKDVKRHLLTQKAKMFLDRILAPSESKEEFIEKIAGVVLDKRLSQIKDKEEESAIDNIIFLFQEIDRYVDISRLSIEETDDNLYSFGITSNTGISTPQMTYRLPKSQQTTADRIADRIIAELSGDENLDVCVLLKLLTEKMSK